MTLPSFADFSREHTISFFRSIDHLLVKDPKEELSDDYDFSLEVTLDLRNDSRILVESDLYSNHTFFHYKLDPFFISSSEAGSIAPKLVKVSIEKMKFIIKQRHIPLSSPEYADLKIPKPEFQSIAAFMQGIDQQSENRVNSLKSFRDAFNREPLVEIYWKKYLSALEEFPSKEAEQFLSNLNKYDCLVSSRILKSMIEFHLQKGDSSSAKVYIQKMKDLLEFNHKEFSNEYGMLLYFLALVHFQESNLPLALSEALNADSILSQFQYSETGSQVKINLLLSAIFYQSSQKDLALSKLISLPEKIKIQYPSILYNIGTIYLDRNEFQESMLYTKSALKILEKKEWENSALYIQALTHYAIILNEIGSPNISLGILDNLESTTKFLNLEKTRWGAYSNYNLAMVWLKKGNPQVSGPIYDRYYKVTPYSTLKPWKLDSGWELHPLAFTNWNQNYKVFTDFERSVIASYTGLYKLDTQVSNVRARTYEARLEDTDEVLKAIFHPGRDGSSIENWKRKWSKKNSIQFDPSEWIFVDVGPALNNPSMPAVTSQSIARSFPNLEVILQELPSEVGLYQSSVPEEAKKALVSFKNIHILSSNGIAPFDIAWNAPENWILTDRKKPNLNDKSLLFRAANSIDIYETYQPISAYFENLGMKFQDHFILYFFNRSILVKEKGSTRFKIIGMLSQRGFYHNTVSLDRQGEEPFQFSYLGVD
jgi:hypothetical protein